MGLADISFLRPLWFLALPVVLVLAVMLTRRSSGLGDWQASIDPHLMAAMASLGRIDTTGRKAKGWLPFLASALICLALTGPAFEQDDATTFRNLDGVVLVMDVSGSMTRDDSWPSVVTMARAGLSGLGSKPAALIVFAGDTYLAGPLTTDHLQLGQTIALLDDKTVPDRGNRPALGLTQAATVLEQANILAGDVVLISDGQGFGPEVLRAASVISGMGARLSVVRAQTHAPDVPPVDAAVFDALVSVGGGSVYATSEAVQLRSDLSNGRETRLERQDLRLLFLTDYGRYLLVLALFPLLLLFRRESQ